MSRANWFVTLFLLTILGRAVGAQEPESTDDSQRPQPRKETPRQLLDRDFERRAPRTGQPLPDVALHAADGTKTSLGKLKGQYTVFVFGCLT